MAAVAIPLLAIGVPLAVILVDEARANWRAATSSAVAAHAAVAADASEEEKAQDPPPLSRQQSFLQGVPHSPQGGCCALFLDSHAVYHGLEDDPDEPMSGWKIGIYHMPYQDWMKLHSICPTLKTRLFKKSNDCELKLFMLLKIFQFL